MRYIPVTISIDPETLGLVEHLIDARKFSSHMRELIRERNEQEALPGLRDAVVKLMAEYKANGTKEA